MDFALELPKSITTGLKKRTTEKTYEDKDDVECDVKGAPEPIYGPPAGVSKASIAKVSLAAARAVGSPTASSVPDYMPAQPYR
mgnify:CR=1 FL=1